MISYAFGKFIPTEDVSINLVSDIAGSIRGFRIFTALRSVQKKVLFHLEDHIDRLFESASEIGMDIDYTKPALTSLVLETLSHNFPLTEDVLVEIIFTGGPVDSTGVVPLGPALPIVLVLPLKPVSSELLEKGVHLATFPYARPFPLAKLTLYVGAILAYKTVVKDFCADFPLFVTDGETPFILEGSTFNFFIVKDGVLFTPPSNGQIINGITRRVVLRLAKENGISVFEKNLNLEDALSADEVFITSSTRNIIGVNAINGRISQGFNGPVTTSLQTFLMRYQALYV